MVADNIVQLIKTKFVLLQKDKYKDKDKDKGRGKTKTGKQGWPSNSKSYFNLSAVHNLEASNLQCGPPMNLLKEIGESGNRHDQWGLGRETRISGEEKKAMCCVLWCLFFVAFLYETSISAQSKSQSCIKIGQAMTWANIEQGEYWARCKDPTLKGKGHISKLVKNQLDRQWLERILLSIMEDLD